jgi:hypothetical protein
VSILFLGEGYNGACIDVLCPRRVGVSIPNALECANAAPVVSSVSVEVVVSTVVTGQAAGPGTTEVAASAAGGGPQTETVVASGDRPASTSRVAESTTTGPIVGELLLPLDIPRSCRLL